MPSGVAIPIASPVFVKLPWARRSSAIRCAFTRAHTKSSGIGTVHASTNSPDVAACSRWTTPPIAAMSTWKRNEWRKVRAASSASRSSPASPPAARRMLPAAAPTTSTVSGLAPTGLAASAPSSAFEAA